MFIVVQFTVSLPSSVLLPLILLSFFFPSRDELPSSTASPACFTILRDPIERVISFYYERVYPITKNNVTMNDLKPTDLEYLMEEFYGTGFDRFRDEVRWRCKKKVEEEKEDDTMLLLGVLLHSY